MSKPTQNIIAMLLAALAFTLAMTSCSPRRAYKVATIEQWLVAPENSVEIRYLDKHYSIGDTLVNQHHGMHIEVITDTAR